MSASANKVLAAEYVLAVGINSWGAIRSGFVPWPAAIVRSGLAFGLLGLLATGAPELATILGGGFLLAALINAASAQGTSGKWTKTFGALPPPVQGGNDYYSLYFGSGTAPAPWDSSINGGSALGLIGPNAGNAKPTVPAPVQPPSLLPGTVFHGN